jgi:hypothetical protein
MVDTKEFCVQHGIEFVERGRHSIFIESQSAVRMVELCREEEIRIFGIEGFVLSNEATIPLLSAIATTTGDETDEEIWKFAESFLELDEVKRATHFIFAI